METNLKNLLKDQGVAIAEIQSHFFADLRYQGQAYELTLQTPTGPISKNWLDQLLQAFHSLHKQRFGYNSPETSVTIVNLRVKAKGPMSPLITPKIQTQGKKIPEPKAQRMVYFDEVDGFVETPIFERTSLGLNTRILGPAVIEQLDSTTLIHPGSYVRVLKGGNLLLEVSP
jgi:N-methylhydantoinase A